MRMTNVRQFIRGGYLTAVEPTEVLRGTEVIGEWHPRVGLAGTLNATSREPSVAVPVLAAALEPEPMRGHGNESTAAPFETFPRDNRTTRHSASRQPVPTLAEQQDARAAIRPFSKAEQAKGKRG